MRPTRLYIFQHLCTGLFAVILMLNIGIAESLAQSSSQVTIVGVPPVLSSPFADDIESNFRGGQYQVIFNYSSFSSQPVDFVFDFTLSRNNRTLVEITSVPMAFSPGSYVFSSFFEEIQFRETAKEILNRLDRDLQNQLVQSGAIPEGNYSVEITARPFTQQTGISAIPGRSLFSVRYPTPPILVSIPDGGNVSVDTPIFSWTPVVSSIGGMFEYEFLLVEVFEGQSALQAINSNREVLLTTLTGQTVLPYTLEYLPLEEGATYAWQVTARDVNGRIPLQNGGETEIYTFTFKEKVQSGQVSEVREIEEISIIPEFASIMDLDRIDVRETGNAFVLDGPATLQLEFYGEEPILTRVNLQNLQIQKTSLDNPIIMGGGLSGRASPISAILGNNEITVELEEVTWRYGENISVSSSVRTPDNQQFRASQRLQLTREGAQGVINIAGDPLYAFSDEMAEFLITELEIRFPEYSVSGSGSAAFFGSSDVCDIRGFSIEDDRLETILHCNDPVTVPLVENSEYGYISIDRILGEFSAGLSDQDLTYDLELNAIAGFNVGRAEICGTEALLSLSSTEGLQIDSGNFSCTDPQPKLDLGFMQLELLDTELNAVTFNRNTGEWDFDFEIDTRIHVPAFDSWTSSDIQNIRVDENGIHFNDINFGDGTVLLPEFDINGFGIGIDQFTLSQFVFPLFDWDQSGPGPWDIDFAGHVEVPNSSLFPSCIRGLTLELTEGQVNELMVTGQIDVDDFPGCSFEIGEALTLQINELGGRFGAEYFEDGTYEQTGELLVDGEAEFTGPFSCDSGQSSSADINDLAFTQGITGSVNNIIPNCEINIGPFSASLTESELIFSYSQSNGQQALMEADAELQLPDGNSVSGSFILDLVTGEFLSVDFELNDPFVWHIPNDDNPVLSFRINSAVLNSDGLLIDGRQRLLIDDDTEIGSTFDNLLIDLQTLRIQSGRVLFDETFALSGGIDTDNNLSFKAVEPGADFDENPGLYIELGTNVSINSDGINASGEANAKVNYDGEEYDDLTYVEFTDDFSFSLYPFGVTSGRANLIYDGAGFAYVDPDGFHPEWGFFADLLIPERLPLPSEDIAYLQLREGDNLLINATTNSDGNYVISTKADTPLSLITPVFNPANPPELANVVLQNVVISSDPTNPEVLEGSISADVPIDDPAFDLANRDVPVTLNRLEFGTRTIDGAQITALYLLGDLYLFEQSLDQQQDVEFYIQNDGFIRANLSMTGLDSRIPLLPESLATLNINEITGLFEITDDFQSPQFDFNILGGIDIEIESGFSTGADVGIRITENTFNVTDFSGIDFGQDANIDFGIFGLDLHSITSMPLFDYSETNGFEFALALDMDLTIKPVSGEEITFPLLGTEFRHTGIHLPPQDINESSIPGLNLPEFNLAGFNFKPLSLETTDIFTFSWGDGNGFNPDIRMDFELQLPDFDGTGLNPPDGLTFTGVSLDEGFLTGSVAPFEPLGGAEIQLMPGMPESPTLWVSRITGDIAKIGEGVNAEQVVSIDIDAELGDLPSFTVDDPQLCTNNPSFTLSLVESSYFEGTVSNIQPCGYLTLGPAQLSVTSSDLNFYVDNNTQQAELDGSVNVDLPSADGGSDISATGSLVVDLINGDINDGSLNINQSFGLNLPITSDDPLLNFTVNQAVLDSSGLSIQGGGNLAADGVNASVQFNNLLFGFEPFDVKSGTATIDADFAAEIGLSPFSLSLKDPNSTMPADNSIRLDLSSAMELNSEGLTFSGTATSTILFGGEEYASLRVELIDGFTINTDVFNVNAGRAEFFDDPQGGTAEDPLAILDQSGFNLGSAILTLLPDRLLLPNEETAYIDIKDGDGNLLVDISENQSGSGYTINTDNQPLQLVIASLTDSNDDPVTVDVEFSVTTDDTYHITDGSISLQSNVDFEPLLNLPVTLTNLELTDNGNGLKLHAGLKADLPGILEEHDAVASVVISGSGLESGTFSLGTYTTAYDPNITPLYTFSHTDNIEGSSETDIFEASLLGVELAIGPNSISFSGTLSSSLIIDEQQGDTPLFFTSVYSGSQWDFDLDPGSALDELSFGQVTLNPDDHNGLGLYTENNSFYLSINGIISLESILGEPLDVTVQQLEIGVNNWNSDPSLHFELGQIGATLADQTFNLFEGAFTGTIESPSLTLNGRTIALSSNTGTVTFLEEDIAYQNLLLDTEGGFQIDQIEANDIDLIDDYITLNSITLSSDQGLRLDSELSITLPAPVDETALSTISIYRDGAGQVVLDISDPAFNLDQEFALGSFGSFKLTKIGADIDPYNWNQSGVYANAEIYQSGEIDPILYFGESANFPDNPGISLFPGQNPPLDYNITGNVEFSFDVNVFSITVAFDQIAATQNGFEITLNGQASLNLSGLDGSLGYAGFTINQDGVEDVGNLDGTGTVDILGIASLTLGQFHYISNPDGEDITLKDTSEKGPDELDADAESAAERTISVVELLCFGPCPADVGGQSDNSAIELSISADSNSDSGFSGGVHSVFMYETTDGERLLYIEDFNVQIDDFFSMSASLNYMQDESDNFILRAAASATFDIGGVSAGAVVAGKFANIDGLASYGLFVAVSADVGIPIVPGVIDLTGAGGGFFYRPDAEDLSMVETALAGFGYDLVDPDALPARDDIEFAVMLYAKLGIAGSANSYMIEGETFLRITNQSFYMDARGTVLQMDGEGIASARVEGAMSFSMQRDPFVILGNVEISLNVPGAIEGDGSIEYFLRDDGNQILWGIIGNADFTVMAGVLSGDGEFLAAQQGFLLELSVGFDVGLPVISVSSQVTGSVWLLVDPDFSMPFGAYVIFEASACLGICITAEAKAAFVVKNPAGFELYASVKGCIDFKIKEACVSAWASVSDNGIKAGFGPGSHNDLVAEARAQRDAFRDKINEMRNQIEAAKDALDNPPPFSGFAYSDEDVRKAGANIYASSQQKRQTIYDRIQDNVETQNFTGASSYSIPYQFNGLINNVLLAERGHKFIDNYALLSPAYVKVDLENAINVATYLSDQVSGRLTEGVETSIDYLNEAESIFDDMLVTMSESPVSNVYKPVPSENVQASPSFDVDETKAEDQAELTESLRDEIEQMDQQFRESITAVETNLMDMHGLLTAEFQDAADPMSKQTVIPGVNTLANQYAHVLTLMERYYALEANKRWLEWEWASDLRSTVQSQSSTIQSGIQTLNNSFNSDLANRNNNPSSSLNYRDEVYRVTQRNHAILRFSNGDLLTNIPSPTNSSAPEAIQTIYAELNDPACDDGTLNCIRDEVADLNMDFWYNMHDQGLMEYATQASRVVLDEVVPAHNQLQSNLIAAHKGFTSLLDEFYTNKATMTSVLYNMIDNYVTWSQTVDNDLVEAPDDTTGEVGVDYTQRLTELSDELVPPQITSLTVDPSRPGYQNVGTYFNITDINWDATHPVGVIENSIDVKQFEDDTDVSLGYNDYLSLGENTSMTVYPYKRAHPRGSNPSAADVQFYNTREMNVGVRVRGYAGNTAIRRAVFNVDVGPGGQSVSSGSNVLPANASPPPIPSLWLSTYYEKSTKTVYVGQSGGQFGFGGGYFPVEMEQYWTNDPSTIKLQIHAHDSETGIATYEYAVGTSRGGTDVVEWSELQGTRNFYAYVPTSEMLGETRLLNMEPGQHYYISVRVTNGAGLQSAVNEFPSPVIYDNEPPTKPERTYVAAPLFTPLYTYGNTTPVDPVLQTVPSLDVEPEVLLDWADSDTPVVNAYWNESTDAQSGISHYEYLVSESETVTADDFGGQSSNTTEDKSLEYSGGFTGSLLEDYDSEIYVHVRAKDNAGLVSDILTIGPLTPTDYSSPYPGRIQAKIDPNEVTMYLTDLPYDPESDLLGIQYAVGTSPGGTDIRNWLSGNDIDFVWNSDKNGDLYWASWNPSTVERYFSIPKSSLPPGDTFYISYRSVNGQGRKSTVRATGPINLDETRPLTPSINLSYNRTENKLSVNLNDIEDPESGIATVRYSIWYPNTFSIIRSWSNMHTHTGNKQGKFNLSKTVSFSQGEIETPTNIRVKIRIKNGAGLERTFYKQVQYSDIYYDFQYNQQVILVPTF